jgi:putative transposase
MTRVSHRGFTTDGRWMAEQAAAFVEHAKREGLPAGMLFRDHDSAYTHAFDDVLEEAGVRVNELVFRSPNLNAYVERFIQSVQQECLDKFMGFGREHMDHLVSEYVQHYHQERPHQSTGNLPLLGDTSVIGAAGDVVCRERLGGVLRHYYRMPA